MQAILSTSIFVFGLYKRKGLVSNLYQDHASFHSKAKNQQFCIMAPERVQHRDDFLPSLLSCGAITTDAEFKRSDLHIDVGKEIHPILQRPNWHPKQVERYWDFIQPALQLATRFLTEPKCLEFWAKLMYGEFDAKGPKHFIHTPEMEEWMLEETRTILKKMADVVRFFPHGTAAYESRNHAATRIVSQLDFTNPSVSAIFRDFKSPLHDPSDTSSMLKLQECEAQWLPPIIAIDFHPKVWDGFDNLDNEQFVLEDGLDSHKLRLNFGLAINIMHEVSHAVWMYTRSKEHHSYKEIYGEDSKLHFDKDIDSSETGFAWENIMMSFVFFIMELVPVTLQCFPKGEEPKISRWSESSESAGESVTSNSDVEHSDKGEKIETTGTWVENHAISEKPVQLGGGDEVVEGGKNVEAESNVKQQEGAKPGEQEGPPEASPLWALGYFPGCPVFYQAIYEHQSEAKSKHDRGTKVWHLVPMEYVLDWFQEATWEDMRTKDVMPQLQACGVIIEEHKNPKTEEGFHGEYVVYKRCELPEAVVEGLEEA